jgi:hypothetical protein
VIISRLRADDARLEAEFSDGEAARSEAEMR